MTDCIAIRGIRAHGKHGALPGERDREQAFDIDIELELDLSAARASDNLTNTVDYARLHEIVVRAVRERSFALLERLADEITRDVLAADSRIAVVHVTVAKPQLLDGATPSVTVRTVRTPAR